MSHQNNSEALRWRCDRCRKLSDELKQCQQCLRFVCKDCMDEYSGLCLDCTIGLLKDPDYYLERQQQLAQEAEFEEALIEYAEMMGWTEEGIEIEGTKCRYCGADIWDEESEYGEIDYNLRKYGYVVCPKCGMILFSEDLVDE